MNKTQNYQLSQWEKSDKVLMEDFNADNAKIDAALKAEADARTGAVAALAGQMSGKGNCRIWSTTYTGATLEGSSRTVTFPGRPLLAIFCDLSGGLFYIIGYGATNAHSYSGGSGRACDVSWNGNSVSLTNSRSSAECMDENGKNYLVVALLALS